MNQTTTKTTKTYRKHYTSIMALVVLCLLFVFVFVGIGSSAWNIHLRTDSAFETSKIEVTDLNAQLKKYVNYSHNMVEIPDKDGKKVTYAEYIYNGEKQGPELQNKVVGGNADTPARNLPTEWFNITYTKLADPVLSDSKAWLFHEEAKLDGKPTDAGIYKMTAVLDDEHKDFEKYIGRVEIKFVIQPKAVEVWVCIGESIYGDDPNLDVTAEKTKFLSDDFSKLAHTSISYILMENDNQVASAGESTALSTLTAKSNAGIYSIVAEDISANYAITYVAGKKVTNGSGKEEIVGINDESTYTIHKRDIKIEFNKNITVTNVYGDTVNTASFYNQLVVKNTSGKVLSVLWNEEAITSVIALSCKYDNKVIDKYAPVGTYDIVPSLISDNYNVIDNGLALRGVFEVTKAVLTMTANDVSIEYGETPEFSVTFSGFKCNENESVLQGTVSYSCTYSIGANAGTFYDITPSLGEQANYTITAVKGKLSIGKRSITVTINDSTSVYGEVITENTLNATVSEGSIYGADKPYTLSTTATKTSNVGSYAVIGECNSTNYNIAFVNSGELKHTITKADVTITADNTTVIYGEDAEFTATIEGLKNNDEIAVTFKTQYAKGKDVGFYDINIVVTAENYPNYSITTVKGKLTVNQREVTITWSNLELVYNGLDQQPTIILGNIYNNETVKAKVDGVGKVVRDEPYTAIASSLNNSNYKLPENATTTFVILPLQAEIEWSETVSFVYDGKEHKPTAKVTNLKGSDVCTVTVAGQQITVGDYTATADSLSNKNYKLPETKPTKEFSITTRPLTVVGDVTSFVYDKTAKIPTVKINNLVEADKGKVSVTVTVESEAIKVATYTATVSSTLSGEMSSNYSLAETSIPFEITKRTVELTWSNTPLVYNGSTRKPTATISNVCDGDKVTVTVTVPNNAVIVGEYTATASLAGDDRANYQISEAQKTTTFNITPYTVDLSKIGWKYGDTKATKNETTGKFELFLGYGNGSEKRVVLDGYATMPNQEDGLKFTISGTNKATAMGTYSATATCVANAGYEGNYTITGSIAELEWHITVGVVPPADSSETITYDGTVKDLINDYISYDSNKDLINVTFVGYTAPGSSDVVTEVENYKNAGSYKFSFELKDKVNSYWNTNNAGGENTDVIELTVVIEQCNVTVTWTNTDLTYNGKEQKPVATVNTLVTGDTQTLTITKKGETTEAVSKDAQTYTATITLSANYNITSGATLEYTINPKSVTVTWSNTDLTYNGAKQVPEATVNGLITGDSQTVNITRKTDGKKDDSINVQDYIATITLGTDGTNYTITPASDATLAYKIKQKEINFPALVEIDYSTGLRAWASVWEEASKGYIFDSDKGTTKLIIDNLSNGSCTYKYTYNITSKAFSSSVVISTNSNYSDMGLTTTYLENNFVGSTYSGTVKVAGTAASNYYFVNSSFVLKYKTAKIGSTYYTIEDAINNGSGAITLESGSGGNYVFTAFTGINYYNKTVFEATQNIVLPYESGLTGSATKQSTTSTLSYSVGSVLYIPNTITLTTTNVINIQASLYQYKTADTTTTGKHAVIMNDGIINVNGSGSIIAYGYLKGYGRVNLNNSSSITDLFHTYDFKGGTNTLTINSTSENYFPINAYSIHNVSCETVVNAGARYYAHSEITMNSSWFENTVIVIGNANDTALFKLQSGYVVKSAIGAYDTDTNTDTNLKTITGSNQTKGQKELIKVYGKVTDGSISITVKQVITKTLKTSKENPVPIPYMNIVVGKDLSGNVGTLNFNNQSYKFMPGTYIRVEEGASFNVASGVQVVLYSDQESIDYESGATGYAFSNYKINSTDAYLMVNGTANITGSISGKITSSQPNAMLTIDGNTTSIVYLTAMDKSSTASMTANGITENGEGIIPKGKYISVEGSNNTYYWRIADTVKIITYNYNGGNGDVDSKILLLEKDSNGNLVSYTIVEADLPATTRNHYTFCGWFTNSACTTPALGQSISADCTLYAKWEAETYSITYSYPGLTAEQIAGIANANPNSYSYSESTAFMLVEPTHSSLSFIGWYRDPELTEQITSIIAGTFGNVTIFGKLAMETKTTYEVTVKTGKNNVSVDNPTIEFNGTVQSGASGLVPEIYATWNGNRDILNGEFMNSSDFQTIKNQGQYNFDSYFYGWRLTYTKSDGTNYSKDFEGANPLITIDGGATNITLTALWHSKATLNFKFIDQDDNSVLDEKPKYFSPGFEIANMLVDMLIPALYTPDCYDYQSFNYDGTISNDSIILGGSGSLNTLTAKYKRWYTISITGSDTAVSGTDSATVKVDSANKLIRVSTTQTSLNLGSYITCTNSNKYIDGFTSSLGTLSGYSLNMQSVDSKDTIVVSANLKDYVTITVTAYNAYIGGDTITITIDGVSTTVEKTTKTITKVKQNTVVSYSISFYYNKTLRKNKKLSITGAVQGGGSFTDQESGTFTVGANNVTMKTSN